MNMGREYRAGMVACAMVVIAVATMVVGVVGTVWATTATWSGLPPPAQNGTATYTEQDFVYAMNVEREGAGEVALTYSPALARVAAQRARQLAEHGSLDHGWPRPHEYALLADELGVPYAWAGENLARVSGGDAFFVTGRLMTSPLHRDNILFVAYTHVGVAVVYLDGAYTWVAVYAQVWGW